MNEVNKEDWVSKDVLIKQRANDFMNQGMSMEDAIRRARDEQEEIVEDTYLKFGHTIEDTFKNTTINGRSLDEIIEDNQSNVTAHNPHSWLKQAVEANEAKLKEKLEEYLKTHYPDRTEKQITMDDVICVGETEWCECVKCQEERHNLVQQLNHPFYKRTDQFREEVKYETLVKASKKYPEPFNPDSWSSYQLAKHAMAENYDQGNYINGLYERIVKLEMIIMNAIGHLREAQTGREDKMAEALNTVISILRDGIHEEGK